MHSIYTWLCVLTGNDINELYAPNTSLERYSRFWVLSNSFLAQVILNRLTAPQGTALDQTPHVAKPRHQSIAYCSAAL